MRGGLVLGFGVLLILLILSGLSALHALSEMQNANETTLRQFLARNQQLDEIRARGVSFRHLSARLPSGAGPGQSGTEPARADRRQCSQIQSLLADNGPLSGAADREMFEALKREIRDYWQTLEPVLSWSLEQRRQEGYAFFATKFSRGDRIRWRSPTPSASVNQQQLMRRDEELRRSFPACGANWCWRWW